MGIAKDWQKKPSEMSSQDKVNKLAFELYSCDEATEVFPDMMMCPVCMALAENVDGDFIMVHKDPKDLIN
jgi:hypothetical protein